MNLRDDHVESRALKNFQCCPARLRMKVIVERIGPQNDVALSGRRRRSVGSSEGGNPLLLGPTLERGRGKRRHAPLRPQMQNARQNGPEAGPTAEKVRKPWKFR